MSGSASLLLGTNGVDPDRKASLTEVFETPGERGRYLQVRITNTTGRLTVRAVAVEAIPALQHTGTITHE